VLATGRVFGQNLRVGVAGAVFASLGGTAAGVALVNLRAGGTGGSLAAEQATFFDAFRAALYVCATFTAIGVFTALVRGSEHRTPAVAGR
jgi:hypothetical protein